MMNPFSKGSGYPIRVLKKAVLGSSEKSGRGSENNSPQIPFAVQVDGSEQSLDHIRQNLKPNEELSRAKLTVNS